VLGVAALTVCATGTTAVVGAYTTTGHGPHVIVLVVVGVA
jgi:hypothetical protein